MSLIYNVVLFFYRLFIHAASFFNEKARLFVNGRKNWEIRLKQKTDENARYIWFHCASLGEFEQGRPVIEEIKRRFPEYKIALTFFSPSGYEIRKNFEKADLVAYLPTDTRKNAKAFLNILRPEKVFFVKYEFWYHFISEIKRRNIPLYSVSAIFRPQQHFFKNSPWGKWFRKMLSGFNHLFVQNEVSASLLKDAGVMNFTISGDTRFDRVAAIAAGAREIELVEKFKGDSLLVVAGSTWKPDEELLAAFINQSSNMRFIIAPHEVSAANINRIQQLLKKTALLFSKAQNSDIQNFEVLIIDSIGLLSSVYRHGNIAYIGGGFGVGIHNILEAATFGLPVIFGPNYKKFKEAVDLVSEHGAFPVESGADLFKALNNLAYGKKQLENASEISKKYVAKNVGATQVIIKKVFNTASVLD